MDATNVPAMLKTARFCRWEEFVPLLKQASEAWQDEGLRCWLAAPDGWSLDWWPGMAGRVRWYRACALAAESDAAEAAAKATEGRIFCPIGELRWRRLELRPDAPLRAVLLAQQGPIGEQMTDRSELLAPWSPRRRTAYLWGQRTAESGQEWIELRIPQRFRYPVHGAPRFVRLVLEEWIDPVGVVQLARFCALEGAEE